MKKLFLLMLSLMALTLNSCSKNDGGDENAEINKLIIDGQSYGLTDGFMDYWGNDGSAESINLVHKGQNNLFFDIEMLAPADNTKLVTGTYNYIEEGKTTKAFTFRDDELYCETGFLGNATDGSIKVYVSENIYTITVDCTITGGKSVKGTYQGSLPWTDISR